MSDAVLRSLSIYGQAMIQSTLPYLKARCDSTAPLRQTDMGAEWQWGDWHYSHNLEPSPRRDQDPIFGLVPYEWIHSLRLDDGSLTGRWDWTLSPKLRLTLLKHPAYSNTVPWKAFMETWCEPGAVSFGGRQTLWGMDADQRVQGIA